jgi:hypothetical protein
MAKHWAAHQNSSPVPEVYERSLAERWRKTGCAGEGAPYGLRTLIARLAGPSFSFSPDTSEGLLMFARLFVAVGQYRFSPFGEDSPEVAKLAAAFLDTEHCLGGARTKREDAEVHRPRSRSVYGELFTQRLRAMGIRDRPTASHSPWQNGHKERLIGPIWRECLDHIIVFGERHLRHVLLYLYGVLQRRPDTFISEQGRAGTAGCSGCRAHSPDTHSRRITPGQGCLLRSWRS